MDISEIGIVASLFSISVAVLKLNRSNNKFNNYVKQPECHQAQERIRQEIHSLKEDLKEHFNIRIDDLKDYIKNNK